MYDSRSPTRGLWILKSLIVVRGHFLADKAQKLGYVSWQH